MELKQLLQEKREEILKIVAKHGAYNIRIFGSVARGEETEASDIDFLNDYDLEKISAWFPGGLILDLETLLNRKSDRPHPRNPRRQNRTKLGDEQNAGSYGVDYF